jgi:signal transduction histidine kinase
LIKTDETVRPRLAAALGPRPAGLILTRALQVGVSAYQLVAAGAFIAALILANPWLRTPFLGALYGQTLVFGNAAPSGDSEGWDLFNQGVQAGDQLVSVNGIAVQATSSVQGILAGFFPGENIPVSIRTAAGAAKSFEVKLNTFPTQDRTTYFVLPSIASFLFLAASLWIFGLRRSESAGRAFAVLSASLSIVMGSLFDVFTTHRLIYVWTLAAALTGGALIDLALSFPKELRSLAGRPLARGFGYIVALGLCAYAFPKLYDQAFPADYVVGWRLVLGFAGLAAVAYILVNLYYGMTAQSPIVKTQARMIVVGSLISFGPLAAWLAAASLSSAAFTPYLLLPIAIFPLTLGYTILRFRFLHADDWIRQGIIYLLLSSLIVGAYALIVTGLTVIFKVAMPSTNPVWIGGLAFLLAVLLDPIRVRLQNFVDITFFRGPRAYVESIQNFAHEITGAVDLPSISQLVRSQIVSTLAPSAVHMFVFDLPNDQYIAVPDQAERRSSDVRFSPSSPLVQYFAKERLPLYLDEAILPASLKSEQTRLRLLGASLFVALPARDLPVGWLALGQRLSGQPYTPRDLTFLDSLAELAAGAVQRVQTVANLEHRVQEMNALTRVSQGVNITLTFDDVLELIYAQTSQIIPLSNFDITLYNKDTDYFYQGFTVEHNERLVTGENRAIPPNSGLVPEVIRRSRPILTQDYARECQARGVTPLAEGVFAWMAVPLNAGAESMGALSVGSLDPSIAYTRAQLELLQAIADQTAGAIVKARLLQETQQRARQLTKLNEVTRQLTSTLELDPLLQNVLESAVGILDCEAGAFSLVDEQSRDLVVRAIAGPLNPGLVGQPLPAGGSTARQAVATRGPIIVNDMPRVTSSQGGQLSSPFLEPRASLAVPLQVKDTAIGVLEVMNRRDGLPFVEEDQTLLTAFAGQAAVAMENARLYTLTDQELAARVEELSVMQRIDRELNASLDMNRAMRLTLDWALRQSNADAGMIGMLEEGKLRVMAHEGYGEALAHAAEEPMDLALPTLEAAVASGLPQRVRSGAGGAVGLLSGAHQQIVIPIRRETSVIGLLMLETTSDTQEDLAFLSRLSDHAAIAISNALLYDEVQRANVAKSDFVSLVAHELKNPMTSIKGYTELLQAGAVGAVNDMQANFLNTIRSNTERMSNLVSDLNDTSKIEAGRLRLDFKSVEVMELVDEVLRSTNRQLDDKKQTLQVELPPELPKVWGDRTRLGQILTNLVSNSNKYTSEGGLLVIGAESSPNHWDPEGAKQVVHLWLRDNGIGIAPEDQQKIFQKFFRSEDPKAREVSGTGLGLNITRNLVEMQGGRIWFESQYRQGSTFHFTVPVAEG